MIRQATRATGTPEQPCCIRFAPEFEEFTNTNDDIFVFLREDLVKRTIRVETFYVSEK